MDETDPLCDSESNSEEEEEDLDEDEDEDPIHTTLKLEDVIITDTDEDAAEGPFEMEEDDELPPILEPPSTGYLHAVNENLPPPDLQPATGSGEQGQSAMAGAGGHDSSQKQLPQAFEVVDLLDSDEGSSNTDSDDELVKVNYLEDPPEGFKKLLQKYKFLSTRDTWIYNVKSMYKKQPSRIKRLLKMHRDAEGNPLEEPIEMLFEKINAERERMNRAQNVKNERVDEDGRWDGVSTVVPIEVGNIVPKLTHVLYPGNVVNNDKAVETLGGMGTISKIFQQPSKKILLKFRPNDPFANGANAQGRSACGLLLRVRHRKVNNSIPGRATPREELQSPKETVKINLDHIGAEPISAELIHDMLLDNQLHVKCTERNDNVVMLNGKKYRQEDLLLEDKLLSEEKVKDIRTKKAWCPNQSKEYNLKLPKILETRRPEPEVKIETLGVVHRSYEFNGICDFQYLPLTKKSDGKLMSIKDRIFPILGAADNPEKLVIKDFLNEETPCQTFSLPPAMSRIDNPPRGLIEELIISERTDTGNKRVPPDESVFSNRMKRIIYTVSYNFQADANAPESSQEIPSQPLSMALKDIERRQIKKDLVENVRMKFEERPIWSKVALEFATKIPSQTLKYIIPNFAYFAANGPWRNTWIRFGLDPRKNPIYVIYQSVDFRIPFIYRRFMNVGAKNMEANHKYLPEHIPPKTQMFYQLCDIKLQEIKELIQTLESKAASGGLVYDERFGFLKEGSYEYFRYIMNYYLENLLQEHGKIPAFNNPEVTFVIPPGHIEPEEKVKAAPHRRVKMKRIRKSVKKSPDSTANQSHMRSPKGKGKKSHQPFHASTSRSYQETLEDLALNKLRSQSGSDDAEFLEEDDDDEDYLDD